MATQVALGDSLLTVPEAAEFLRISKSYFYELVSQGKVKTCKIGPKKTVVTGREIVRVVALIEAGEL